VNDAILQEAWREHLQRKSDKAVLLEGGMDYKNEVLPHAYERLSPKRLAPGKPVMNVRLSVRRCLRILGVEIAFPEIRQRAIYCPCCAHTETDVMKIVALAGV
jgi:hypothetical protein